MDCYLSELPKETKNIIVSFLDDRSRRIMRLASIEWFNIINYDDFTIYFARTSTLPDIIQTFSRYSKPIGFHFEKTTFDSTFTALAALTNITTLEVENMGRNSYARTDISPVPFTALTNLQNFVFSSVSLAPHLQLFKTLTSLIIPYDFKLKLAHLDQLHHLTKLKQFSFNMPYGMTDQINVISKLGNPSLLKDLYIMDDQGSVYFDEDSVARMSNMSTVSIECRDVLFPFTKLPNLESMHISSDRFDDFSACSTKLTYLSIQARGSKKEPPKISALNQDYHELAVLTNLRVLKMYTALKEDRFSFLVNLTNLETLTVTEKIGGLTGQLLEWIKSTNLKTLTINRMDNINYIAHLTSLENVYTGEIADVAATCSMLLSNVTSLATSSASAVTVFPNLRRLEINQIYQAEYLDDLPQIGSLQQLESLSVPTIGPKALPVIVRHTQLTSLKAAFDYEEKYDFTVLDRLTNLKILSLKSDRDNKTNNVKVLWRSIAKMTNLEELDMFDISVRSVASLEQLHKLTRLSVTGVCVRKFNETKLSNMTNLQVISLSSGFLFDRMPKHTCLLNLPLLYDCWVNTC